MLSRFRLPYPDSFYRRARETDRWMNNEAKGKGTERERGGEKSVHAQYPDNVLLLSLSLIPTERSRSTISSCFSFIRGCRLRRKIFNVSAYDFIVPILRCSLPLPLLRALFFDS